ncbi:phage tail assembly chaperone [Pseudomonas putida]|uniref:phage tail assembly chaperone n=1 Tax=Pseudomonas putida TaxID=303 RepID=UPI002169BD96|nr:phage tail assembly chaperone [Pseudomonas putida]MCS4061732.1 hypothetical protein [Pseudomonas putida]
MSKSKAHFSVRNNRVFAVGELDNSERFIEIDNFEEAFAAFNAQKDLMIEDGALVIRESRALQMQQVRRIRDSLLSRTDVMKLKLDDHVEITGEDDKELRVALASYRQALRDVTLQDPFNVIWPILEANDE